MSFLIRAAFWLSLVILILPSDPGSETRQSSLSTSDALFAAKATLGDVTTFCMRQPDVCAAGEVALENFSAKARYGAKQLYVYLDGEAESSAEADKTAPPEVATLAKTELKQSPEQQELTALVKDLQR